LGTTPPRLANTPIFYLDVVWHVRSYHLNHLVSLPFLLPQTPVYWLIIDT